MSDLGKPQPRDRGTKKPPKRNWEATRKDSFLDLKLSHYVNLILTAALAVFAWLQYTVYTRQAGIMEIEQRPYIGGPKSITPKLLDSTPNPIMTFTHVFKNVGHTPTATFNIEGALIDDADWVSQVTRMCNLADEAIKTQHPPFIAIPNSNWVLDLNQMPPSEKRIITLNEIEKMKSPYIVGCGAYTSAFEKTIHHTGYYGMVLIQNRKVSVPSIYSFLAN